MSPNAISGFPKRHQFTAISTPVGSGKTRAAVEYMAHAASCGCNFIYAAPTIRLIEQTHHDLRTRLEQAGARAASAVLVHSGLDPTAHESVIEQVMKAVHSAGPGVGRVVICTTSALISVLSRVRRPEAWGLLLDEAFPAGEFVDIPLGLRKVTRAGSLSAIKELFDVVEEEGNRVIPAQGKATMVTAIGRGDWGFAGVRYPGFQRLAKAVSNPVVRVELINPGNEVLEEEGDLVAACYVTPEYFCRFKEVLFMSALFERSPLYQLWTRHFGVLFSPHPVVNMHHTAIRNLHEDQGPYVSIGHLLHPADSSSLYTLSRAPNALAADAGNAKRVVDELVAAAGDYFAGERFLLQVNARFGYDDRSAMLPAGAISIPVMSHGLNAFHDVDNVVALAVTNPKPHHSRWWEQKTGLTRQEVAQGFRVPTQYQALGRCSVRNPARAAASKTFLVVSQADAEAQLRIWARSRSLGQIGNVSRRSAQKAPKAEAFAAVLLAHLRSLPPAVVKVSLRSLRALLPAHHEDTWTASRELALASATDWVRCAQSIERVSRKHPRCG